MAAVFYHMLIALAASAAPDLHTQLEAAFAECGTCRPMVMDDHQCSALSGLIDHARAPLLEIIECGGHKVKLKNGYAARSWAYQSCGRNPKSFTLALDDKGRIKQLRLSCE